MKITPTPDLSGLNYQEILRAVAMYKALCQEKAHYPCGVSITFEQAKGVPNIDLTKHSCRRLEWNYLYGVPIVITGMTPEKQLELIEDMDYWRSKDKEMIRL